MCIWHFGGSERGLYGELICNFQRRKIHRYEFSIKAKYDKKNQFETLNTVANYLPEGSFR